MLDEALYYFISLLNKTSEHFRRKVLFFCIGAMTCVRAKARKNISWKGWDYNASIVTLCFEDRQDMFYHLFESSNWGGDNPPPPR
jgi:hypothetical protein